MDTFSFASSRTLNTELKIRIINLEGEETPWPASVLLRHPELRHVGSNTTPNFDLYVTAQVYAGCKPLTVPVQTSYKAFKNERRWSEWLTLPIKYSLLPLNSFLAITIWDLSPAGGENAVGLAAPFGSTTLPIFDRDNQLLKGRQKCVLHRLKRADGNDTTTTPAFAPNSRRAPSMVDEHAEELERMEKLFKRYEMDDLPRVDWLDKLVFRNFERQAAEASKSSLRTTQARTPMNNIVGKTGRELLELRPGLSIFFLAVELPRFDFPIVFVDHEYPVPRISCFQPSPSQHSEPRVILKPPPEVQLGPGIDAVDPAERLFKVYDPEAARENPCETKHRRLFRSSHRHGVMDKDLKPNAKVRDELNVILSYPPTRQLSSEETDLVWKFRYHLTRDKRALTKFAKSVNWSDAAEAKQATEVIERWIEIDVDDALELLGPSFSNAAVRTYAVDRLRKADDDELLLYLLQLVQALKYEQISADAVDQAGADDSSLARFLIIRAAANFTLGNYFYWYLTVECDDQSSTLGQDNRNVFRKVAYEFVVELERRPGCRPYRKTLLRQAQMVTVLSKISTEIKTSHETIPKKTERVKQLLSDIKNELVSFDPPLPLPLDPDIKITGVVPEQTTVFKSTLCPIKVTFKTSSGDVYPIIFKTGDDLRQDQLVIQIITLMDQLLQKENLDLRLSPYKIIATAPAAGASQFVPSASLSAIAGRYRGSNPALAYLKDHNPDSNQPSGVRKETLDTYVRSCAGYCVITYILGVGDRHLDNLLLATDGHFFHADFGYILGRDPKPFAPLMKLSREMVEAMGGTSSEHYRQFKQYCFLAYAALRKSSNLILNLFSLMVGANIPDIRLEPDKAVDKVRERFHLELGEEDAMRSLENIIENALAALAPVVIDKLHELVQAFRT